MLDSSGAFPEVDAAARDCISQAEADFFRRNGLLVLRSVLTAGEVAELQHDTLALVTDAIGGRHDDPDFCYTRHPETGEVTPFRVEYVVDKLDSCKRLLGHPFILRTVERLQGPGFIPTWDSMVFKSGGAGAPIPWHRDGGQYPAALRERTLGRVFNVDVYLDRADLDSCVWGLLGSNRWTDEEAYEVIGRMNEGGVSTDGAVPITMEPGDVLVHDVMVLHGSAATRGPLRRVLYYEFRPLDVEDAHGPHTADYIEAKQHVLAAAVRRRKESERGAVEMPFVYRPRGADAASQPAWAADPPTWRYPHEEFWRWPVTA